MMRNFGIRRTLLRFYGCEADGLSGEENKILRHLLQITSIVDVIIYLIGYMWREQGNSSSTLKEQELFLSHS